MSKRRSTKPKRHRLQVTGWTGSGAGEARLGDASVSVRGALAGETVDARVEGKHATTLEVIAPHPERVEPPCAIADRCGGCDWMHLSPSLQRRVQLELWMRRLGDWVEAAPALVEVEPALGYRCRARLGLRAKLSGVRIGYRKPRSHHLVEIAACPILRPELVEALPELRQAVQGSVGEGEVQLALGVDARPVMDLRWTGELHGAVFGRIHTAVEAARWAGARVWEGDVAAPAQFGDPRPQVKGPDGKPLWMAPGGFSQPSDEGGAALSRHVAAVTEAAMGPCEGEAVELFAGSGTLTVALRGGPLASARGYVAVEEVAAAGEAMTENLAARGLPAVKRVTGDANTHRLPRGLDLVVLDPPRRGAAGAMEAIAAARPRYVVYVSCHPGSLARDLRGLTERYRCVDATLFQLFAQTHHVETVMVLQRLQ